MGVYIADAAKHRMIASMIWTGVRDFALARTRQNIRCSHTQNLVVGECSEQLKSSSLALMDVSTWVFVTGICNK